MNMIIDAINPNQANFFGTSSVSRNIKTVDEGMIPK
jgi:hypothetical protein